MSDSSSILLPIDLSDTPDSLIAEAVDFARSIGATIFLLHVIPMSSSIESMISNKERSRIEKDLDQKLCQFTKDCNRQYDVPFEYTLRSGKVHKEIISMSEDVKPKFILLWTRNNHQEDFIGTSTLSVIRHSSIPVISFKGDMIPCAVNNILLPLDLTKPTEEKIAKAIEIAKSFNNAQLLIVSALTTHDDFAINRLTRKMAFVKDKIIESGIKCTAELIKGLYSEAGLVNVILEYAVKSKCDMMVTMTQEEENRVDYYIGSKAQELINQDLVPVITLTPEQALEV